MASRVEETRAAFDAAVERYNAALEDVATTRREWEEAEREEEAKRRAVYEFGPGADEDEVKVLAATALAMRSREAKQREHERIASLDHDELAERGPSGAVGGVS